MVRWGVVLARAGLGLVLLGGSYRLLAAAHEGDEVDAGGSPELTPRPPVTPHPPKLEEVLPICPPRQAAASAAGLRRPNMLLVSTLDGQLSALDLSKDGEMFWSVSTYPGPMLSSTISQMDLDSRGQYVKLIPSLNGRLYKFNGEVVEPIPMNVDTLLGTSLKMQENMVITGGKESRTYGIDLNTGHISYECSMNDCTNFQATGDGSGSPSDMLVVQRNTQTVRAHVPRTGEQKWNFSVSLHDVAFHPVEDPCAGNADDDIELVGASTDAVDDLNLKAIVPDGLICATDEQDLIRWRRKFPSPIVDVWRLRQGRLERVDLFSKQHIPPRRPPASLLDDDDKEDDEAQESPFLYIGSHQSQLYIQESVRIRAEADAAFVATDKSELAATSTHYGSSMVAYPRVTWRPYLVSPSRTPVINHGGEPPEVPLLSFQQTISRGDAQSTALAITTNSGEYPYDSGFYLYPDTTSLTTEDPMSNITNILHQMEKGEVKEEEEETTVEFIYMGLSHWWKEVVFISLMTAVLMNVMITRPIIHEMRDNFQQRSRELVYHFQNNKEVREVLVEVPVPATVQQMLPTSSTSGTLSSSGTSLASWDRQISEFSSRYLTDFEPVQCLGRGGFGVVFESKNKIDDIHYAVKRITLPSTEASKKKVMREVKLHAKLDHRNIVRYYSTWLETPPPGWQEQADAWFLDSADQVTGQASWEPTASSAHHCSRSEAAPPPAHKRIQANPLRPFRGFSQGSEFSSDFINGPGSQLDATGDSVQFSNSCDNGAHGSISISFEDSRSGGGDDDSDSSRPDQLGGLSNRLEISYNESTGGIAFQDSQAQDHIGEGAEEEQGEAEMVALDIEGQEEEEEGEEEEGSLSCYEALDWEENHNAVLSQDKPVKTKSYLYIVMQLCKKETLRDWLKNNMQRDQRTVFRFFNELCVGVDYVHNQGLIHRDLKPCNIYFSLDGCIKIGDFGLVTGSTADLSSPGTASTARTEGWNGEEEEVERLTEQVGTQLYMSPEQLAQRPYNHRVDIFSLGLILLELLVPFATQMERLRVLSDGKQGRYPPSLHTQLDIKHLLDLMLNHNPDLRPEASEILQLPWMQEYEERPAPRPRRNTTGLEPTELQDTR